MRAHAAFATALLLTGFAASAQVADGRGLFDPPPRPSGAATPGAQPWIDAQGADHRQRDAERRAREAPPAPWPYAGVPGTPGTPGTPGAPGTQPAAGVAPDPAQADALRRQGERERDARDRRGGLAPPPEPTPRIQPDAPTSPSMPPPPRIAIPLPGEPGGPPIALPTCGPAGCFDANGRPIGGTVPLTPEGLPCNRVGNVLTCPGVSPQGR